MKHTVNLNNLVILVYENKNNENKIPMEKYMKNKFLFLGIKTPLRKELCKKYFKLARKQDFSWKIFEYLWNKKEREFQYIAIDYLKLMEKHLTKSDLTKLQNYIIDKSWWDSVDAFQKVINKISFNYDISKEMLNWSKNNNFWIRRISIIHQLHKREFTNTKLLEEIILNNLNSNEFFINKAIGWALRDYSKLNPEWVKSFINKYKNNLDKLSIKEGSKYIV